ncbi:MAG: hypothetical protein JW760_14675 [Spirochaetales bacterium]|nr:hypothetical protein [Spirochaetales bacterium]
MTKTLKKVLYLLLGTAAGFLVWFLLEIQMNVDGGTLYFRLILQGGIIGAVYGALLGMGEGIALSIGSKTIKGFTLGLVAGFIAGGASILAAQGILMFLTEARGASVTDITGTYLPIARIPGWTLIGCVLGIIEGIRSRSFRRLLFGLLGGFLGGLVGGLIYEGLHTASFNAPVLRLAGFSALGILLGIGLSVADSGGRFGILKVMNGKFKGKEYILSKKKSRIGSSAGCDIILPDETEAKVSALVVRTEKKLHLVKVAQVQNLFVNDSSVERVQLKYEDVIRCGKTALRFMP